MPVNLLTDKSASSNEVTSLTAELGDEIVLRELIANSGYVSRDFQKFKAAASTSRS